MSLCLCVCGVTSPFLYRVTAFNVSPSAKCITQHLVELEEVCVEIQQIFTTELSSLNKIRFFDFQRRRFAAALKIDKFDKFVGRNLANMLFPQALGRDADHWVQ